MDLRQLARIRLLVFDLDGTLIDSKQDLVNSVNATREWLGLGPLPHDTISSYVGNGAPVLIRRAIGPDYSDEEHAQALEFFLTYYRAHKLDHTRFYPGVREALDAFGDRTLAVLTNKPVRITNEILQELGVARYFRHVYGGNSFETKKPHPEGVLNILRDAGVEPDEAIMVGDSDVDVLTGRNAGIFTCGVSYGFAPHTFELTPPDVVVHSMGELAALLDAAATQRAGAWSPELAGTDSPA
jgi:phosphoglycolate phosphatase